MSEELRKCPFCGGKADVGNWFFLTQSEAEEKLRELEGKQNV